MQARTPESVSFDHPVFSKYPALRAIVTTSLHPAPRKRYRSAADMRHALNKVLAAVPPSIRSDMVVHGEKCGYGLLERLGGNDASELFMARNMADGTTVAVRRFPESSPFLLIMAKEERDGLRNLNHPGLVHYLDFG